MKNTFLLLLLISQFAFSQKTDSLQSVKMTPQQMKEDFAIYKRVLEETHPGLYRYTPKEEIQEVMDSVASTLQESKSYYSFYTDLALISSKIKCAHSYVTPIQDIQKYILTSIKTVPFYLHAIGEKQYVLFNGSSNEKIKPGFELVSINGKSSDQIRDIIYKYAWSDADIESAKISNMTGSYFWMMYYLFVDQSDQFTMQFKDLAGKKHEFQLPAQTPKSSMAFYKKNPVNKEMLNLYRKNSSNKPFKLSFSKDIKKTAVLSLNSFGGKGMNNEDAAQAITRKFMEKAIKKIKKAKTESLIVDLRYNGGGWNVIAMEILSYLIKNEEPIQYYKEAFAATNSSEFLKFTGFSPSDYTRLKEELIPLEDGTFRLEPKYNISLRPYTIKKNRFEGDLYFIIHEMTGSAASEFAGLAKDRELGILVGTETNAAYQGGNSSTFIKMPLPHSGIFVNSPLVSEYHGLKPQKVPNRGVIPHYEVNFTQDDLLQRYDRHTEFVKDLIREKKLAGSSPK